SFLIRTSADPLQLAPAIRAAIRSMDKNIAVNKIDRVEDLVRASFANERYRTALIAVFALTAAGLALIGLYGVVSRYVAYRDRELGVRLAVGARPQDIVTLILTRGLVLTICGAAIGALGAIAVTRAFSDLLFEVTPLDTAT